MKKNLVIIPLILLTLLTGCDKQTSSSSQTANTLTNALNYSKEHSFAVHGKVYTTYQSGDESYDLASFDIYNIFDEGFISSKLIYHYQLDDTTFDDEYNATYFAKEDGYTYKRELTLKNIVEDTPVSNKNGDKIKFNDNFVSPFLDLKYANFVKMDDTFLLKPQVSTSFATTLTQQRIVAKKTIFKLNDGKFSSLIISTDSSSTTISGIYASYRYELNFSWDIKGEIPNIEPFKHEAYHDDLENALFTLNRDLSKKNFTATTNVNINGQESTGSFYATADAIYSTATDSLNKTYGVKKEGSSYYEFAISTDSEGNQTVTVYDEDPIDGNIIYPQYNAFAPELFTKVNNEFVAASGTESAIINLIAPFTEVNYYTNYITSLKIILNNNKFDSLYFEYYDYQNNINGKATITYKDIGSTELPITL